MEQWNFYVPTVTQAMRGKEVLARAGIRGFVSRNTDMHAGAGCSYRLTVTANAARAEQLLRRQHIEITRKDAGR